MTDEDETRTSDRRRGTPKAPTGFADTIAGEDQAKPRGSLSRGDTIGRYLVLRRLGAGAMGVVYAAHDRELAREVAIKVLHPDETRSDVETRLVREAQALARLAHPNVVTVHDVGAEHTRVYIAMELVEGLTLRDWYETGPPLNNVISCLLDAARGLAAAHASGIIHRDFKPDNVMIGNDGRVRVMDFGLAKAARTPQSDPAETPAGRDLEREDVSVTGSLSGTPAYISPEQWNGSTADEATDQFAFCVTAWELLTGRRPFRGATLGELCEAVCQGRLEDNEAAGKLPRWFRKILRRGLARDADQRWPSIAALIAATEAGLRRRRRVRLLALGGTGALILGGLAGGDAWRRRRADAACEAEGSQAALVWSGEARALVSEALRRSGASYAEKTSATVESELDEWVEEWRRSAVDACRRSPPDTKEHACLQTELIGLEVAVEALSAGDPAVVQTAVDVVRKLDDPTRCSDPRFAATQSAESQDVERTRSLRRDLHRAEIMLWRHDLDGAIAVAAATIAEAETAHRYAVAAQARFVRGRTLLKRDDATGAAAELRAAYLQAAQAGARPIARATATALASVTADELRQLEAGRVWADAAEAALMPDEDPLGLARLLSVRGSMEARAKRLESAVRFFRAALARIAAAAGEQHPSSIDARVNLATTLMRLGELKEAGALVEGALELIGRDYGETHPKIVTPLLRSGNIAENEGDFERALLVYRRALDVSTAANGEDHSDNAFILNSIGSALIRQAQPGEAAPHFLRSHAILSALYGPADDRSLAALGNLATAQMGDDLYDTAAETTDRVVRTIEGARGANDPALVNPLLNLADMRLQLGQLTRAGRLAERAVAILAAGGTPRPRAELLGAAVRGRAAAAQERWAVAVESLERAMRLEPERHASVDLQSAIHLDLARAVFRHFGPGELERARSLALRAQELATEGGFEKEASDAAAWLAEHGRRLRRRPAEHR